MRTLIALALVAMLGLCATAATAALQYDFEDGMQGWYWYHGTDTRITFIDGEWVMPGVQPDLIPGVMGASGGNLFCPADNNGRAIAMLDLSDKLVGGVTSSYLFRADVYIPNLRPARGFPWNYPGMTNQYSGIGALMAGTDWGTMVWGRPDKGTQVYIDYTGSSWAEKRATDWIMEEVTSPDTLWWNQWITLEIDWNYSVAGNVIARVFIPWQSPMGPAGRWWTMYNGAIEMGPGAVRPVNISRLMVGACPTTAKAPWSKSQFDNVYFDSPDLVPEPGSLLALGSGLLGLLGVVRRRKA